MTITASWTRKNFLRTKQCDTSDIWKCYNKRISYFSRRTIFMTCHNILERDQVVPHDRTILFDVLSDFHTDMARRNPCRDAYARRNGYTIDVPLSPYIIRLIGQCNHAIFRIAITRDGRICRGALHAELATSALRSSGKSKIPACVTRREAEWWLMPVSPRFSYLTYLDSVQHAPLHISPVHIYCPPCVFLVTYLGSAQFSLFKPTAMTTFTQKLCHADKIKN